MLLFASSLLPLLLLQLVCKAVSSSADVPPYQHWPPGLPYVQNCRAFIDGMPKVDNSTRFGVNDTVLGPTTINTCEELLGRGYYPTQPLSDTEEEFPLAFVNLVYRDYLLLERILATTYQPQNLYCYAVDVKADSLFKKRLRHLARCMPARNVIVSETDFAEFDMDSSGHGISKAFVGCLRELSAWGVWRYVLLMHGQDMPLKTNAQMVRIAHLLNGTNDVHTLAPTSPWGSYNTQGNYSFANLHLYKEESRNHPADGSHPSLQVTKTFDEVFLSRDFVDFIVDELYLDNFIAELEENTSYGMDENLLSSINANDYLRAPGGFTSACLRKSIDVAAIGRHTIWHYDLWRYTCGAANEEWRFRNDHCRFMLEDLHRLAHRPELTANKFWPALDYKAVDCWLEWLYNRTHGLGSDVSGRRRGLDEELYTQLPHVRFNRMDESEREAVREGKMEFNCSQRPM